MHAWIAILLLVAQEPPPISVLATPQVDLGDYVQIHVETTGTAKQVRVWRVEPGPDQPITKGLLELAGGDFALVAPQGTYRIEAQAIVGEAIVSADAEATVGPPGPRPDPTPTPPGQRWVVVLRETSQATPEQARFLTSLRNSATQTYVDQKNHKLLILDDDSVTPLGTPVPEVQAWLKQLEARQIKLPALLVVDPSQPAAGGVLSAGSLPSDPDAILETLKQHGG